MKLLKLKLHTAYKNLPAGFEVDFSKDNGLTVLVGNNGSGKSNILRLLTNIIFEWNFMWFSPDLENDNIQFVRTVYDIKNQSQRVFDIIDSVPDYSLTYTILLNDVDAIVRLEKVKGEKEFRIDNKLSDRLELLPKLITIYSGENNKLKLPCNLYANSNLISDLMTLSNFALIHVNQSLCDIAFFTLLLYADKESNNDAYKFLYENFSIEDVEDIVAKFNNKNSNVRDYSAYTNDYLEMLSHYGNKLHNPIKDYKRIVSDIDIYANSPNILFQHLAMAKICGAKSIDIIIQGDSDFPMRSFYDFSEGEKKLILIKAIAEYLSDDNTVILLDEPDANVHESRKIDMIDLLQGYNPENPENSENSTRQFVMTTHSPTIIDYVNDNQLQYLVVDSDLHTDCVSKDKVEVIKQMYPTGWRNRVVSMYNKKTLVLLEGQDDVRYIKRALDLFSDAPQYKKLRDSVDFASFNGASQADEFIRNFREMSPDKRIVVLFDDDKAGRVARDKIYGKYSYFTCGVYKRTNEGEKCSIFLLEDYFPTELATKMKDDIVISHPFRNAVDLSKHIKSEIENNYANYSKEVFVGFKVVLDQINDLVSKADCPISNASNMRVAKETFDDEYSKVAKMYEGKPLSDLFVNVNTLDEFWSEISLWKSFNDSLSEDDFIIVVNKYKVLLKEKLPPFKDFLNFCNEERATMLTSKVGIGKSILGQLHTMLVEIERDYLSISIKDLIDKCKDSKLKDDAFAKVVKRWCQFSGDVKLGENECFVSEIKRRWMAKNIDVKGGDMPDEERESIKEKRMAFFEDEIKKDIDKMDFKEWNQQFNRL